MNAVGNSVKEALYTAVGLGVIGAQSVQVRRRQLQREADARLAAAADGLWRVANGIDRRVDPLLDHLGPRLPEVARTGLEQARHGADAVRNRIISSAARAPRRSP